MRVSAVIALVFVMAIPANGEVRPTAREGAAYAVPLYGELVRTWDAPDDNPFVAGHRGIDVAAPAGTSVRASADGVVSFSGSVPGNRSVTIDHGDGIRTSYSFLQTAAVAKNAQVRLGDVIGTVGAGHPGSDRPHVHLSARRAETYFDPISLYLGTDVVGLVALTA